MSYCLPRIPFQWRGSKKAKADVVWQALGDPHVYCEPFGGRLDVLFSRPESGLKHPIELVGDRDAMITNFFRSACYSGTELARMVDSDCLSEHNAVSYSHWVLKNRDRICDLMSEGLHAHDVEAAYAWLYEACCKVDTAPTLSFRQKMVLSFSLDILEQRYTGDYFAEMSKRLQGVEILCAGWETTTLTALGLIQERLRKVRLTARSAPGTIQVTPRQGNYRWGYFLDPPYPPDAGVGRRKGQYHFDDDGEASDMAFRWAKRNGDDPRLRIVCAGLAGAYEFPENWRVLKWGSSKCRRENLGETERLWLSPHCLPVTQYAEKGNGEEPDDQEG